MTRPSVLDLLTEGETAAGMTAERLREQIATLTEQLTAAGTELAELAITRKTLLRLTGHAVYRAKTHRTWCELLFRVPGTGWGACWFGCCT